MAKVSYQAEVVRKLIHLASLWMPAAIYFLDKNQALRVLGAASAGMVLFEILRRQRSSVSGWIRSLFQPIFRSHEHAEPWSLTGGTYMLIAAFICACFFSKLIAAVAMTILIISDTAAALVGRAWGRPWILGKSLSGSAAFFACTAVILDQSGAAAGSQALLIAAVLTVVELFSAAVHLDDNLTIPLSAAWLLSFLPHYLS